ncbi:MAG: hypothetical protein IT210_17875, partial [Armatimonadetes bacterium]|nr:hypothetical protein [Armatimonadota bacterium]
IFEQQRDGIMQAGSGGLFAHNVAVRNRYGLKLFRDGCIGNTFANNIFIYNKDGQVGLDNAGGRTPWPSSNLIDYSAVYPMRRWLLPTSVSSWAGKSMILKDPLVMGYQWNDLRLSATSPARKKAFPLKMNGAYSWPDPGLFPATNYTEPAWW